MNLVCGIELDKKDMELLNVYKNQICIFIAPPHKFILIIFKQIFFLTFLSFSSFLLHDYRHSEALLKQT